MPGVGQICKICRARSCFADAGMGEKGGTEDWSERLFWSGTLQGPGGMGFGVRRSKAQVMIGVGRFRAMFHQCMNEAVIGVFVARS